MLLQRYIQTDIRGYSPAPGDLAYPDKLLVAAQATAVEVGLDGTPDTTDSDSVFEASGTEVGGTVPVLFANGYTCMCRVGIQNVSTDDNVITCRCK